MLLAVGQPASPILYDTVGVADGEDEVEVEEPDAAPLAAVGLEVLLLMLEKRFSSRTLRSRKDNEELTSVKLMN